MHNRYKAALAAFITAAFLVTVAPATVASPLTGSHVSTRG